MSIKNDVEVLANVPAPSGTQQSLYLDSVTNLWYSKIAAGTSYPVGATVANSDGTITVSGTGNYTVTRPAITGDVSIPVSSNVATLSAFGPGATGPIGSASTVPVVTIDAKGRVSALTSATITPAAIGAPSGSGSSTGTNTGDQTITLTGDVNGSGTGSFAATIQPGVVSNAKLATMAAHTVKANITGSTAAPTDSPMTSLSTGEYDITCYGVLTSNSGTANATALNALAAAVPAGSCLYTPPGLFQIQGALTTFPVVLNLTGVHGQSTWAWVNVGVTTTNLITLDAAGYYACIRDMIFQTFVTMTTNYVIECGNAPNVFIEGCLFVGGTTTPLSGCIDFTGTNSGNGAVVRACYFSGWHDTGINVSSPLSSPFFSDIEMIGNGLASGQSAAGIACQNGGAILMTDCGIVRCTVNVNITATVSDTVASIFCVNCFFDQGVQQSLLITGAGTVLRSHFVGCWFTTAAAGSSASAIQIATTGSSVHGGLVFNSCWIVNTPAGGGSPIGLNIAACSDIHISDCQIAGWTTGINVVPVTGSTSVHCIGNIIGASGGVGANTTGITLGSGSYSAINIQANNLQGNTTPLSDTGPSTATNGKLIIDNLGLSLMPQPLVAAVSTSSTTETIIHQIALPANSLLIGTTFKITAVAQENATANTGAIFHARIGTTGGITDASIALSATTAVAASAQVVVTILVTIRTIGSGGTAMGGGYVSNGVAANIAILGGTAATVNTTVANFLSLSASAAAGALSFSNAVVEVIRQ